MYYNLGVTVESKKKKLVLIDGSSLLYRSYYAIRFLTNSDGFPTNAIYGFIMSLKKLMDQEAPDYLGVVFDTKGPTERHKLFTEYKAHRKPMPEDLVVQIPPLKKIIKAMNIPTFEQVGHEADDILGTFAHAASKEDIQTVIVTTDKDLLQMIDDNISVYNPTKDILLDEKGVKEFFGVSPSQIIDVLALWGDSSDNIPGVPGIGEKTAKSLVTRFGSLDNLLANLSDIEKESVRKKIENNLGGLELSRKLVTIFKDLNINFSAKEMELAPPDTDELLSLYQELGFSSLVSEHIKTSNLAKKKYATILEEDALQKLISKIKKSGFVAIDTETDSPFPTKARLVGISFSIKPHQAYYLPLRHDYPNAPDQIPKKKAIQLLEDVLVDPKIKKTGQNIKYDFIVLHREGVTLQGIDLDTMVLSYLLEPNWGKHNLNKLATTYLQVDTIPYQKIVGKGKNEVTMNAVDIEKVTPYACQDADLAFQLGTLLWPKVKEKNVHSLYETLERPLIQVLADMEMWGVKINPEVLENLSEELQQDLDTLQAKIYAISQEEFNINSPKQLGAILFEKMGIPSPRKTRKTKSHATDMSVLKELAEDFPIARHTLEYRQFSKLKSTYSDALPRLINRDTGRIHTSYNQTVAATGRLSSSDPNLQNIPARGELGKRCRQAFIPEDGNLLLSADYSQIELRVLAHLSEDPVLIETFLQNRDIHQDTASQVFGEGSSLFPEEQRRRAKIINFSIIYGTSAFSLAKELGTATSEAQEFIDLYFARYPKVRDFLETSVTDAQTSGVSRTLFGRIRPVPELKHENRMVQQAGRRIALNTPIQGTAADLMKKAMIDIWEEIRTQEMKSKIILQVHDELVFEVPQKECSRIEPLVREKMEKVFSLKVPLKVHLGWGINWAETK
jgi:DNA polymerase-1